MIKKLPKDKSFVKEKFDKLVRRYDLVNSLASFFQDHIWRNKLIKTLKGFEGPFLDLCCGPYTLTRKIFKSKKEFVYSLDLSLKMLLYGKTKYAKESSHILSVRGDAERLPFKKESFGAITIAFGLRNLPNKKAALKEFHRVLKKNGTLIILEFSLPTNFFLKKIYLLYLKYYIPFLGKLLTGDKEAYDYLAESIQKFPPPQEMNKLLKEMGFQQLKIESLTFGVVTLYTYIKT